LDIAAAAAATAKLQNLPCKIGEKKIHFHYTFTPLIIKR